MPSHYSLKCKPQGLTPHAPRDTRHATPDTRHATPDTRHAPPDTRHPTRDTRHAPPDTRHATRATRPAPSARPALRHPEGEAGFFVESALQGLAFDSLDAVFAGEDEGSLGEVAAVGIALPVSQGDMRVDDGLAVLEGDIPGQVEDSQASVEFEEGILAGLLVVVADARLLAPSADRPRSRTAGSPSASSCFLCCSWGSRSPSIGRNAIVWTAVGPGETSSASPLAEPTRSM